MKKPIGARVWTAGRLVVLGALLSLTYGAFFLTSMRVTAKAREVKVPDVRGQAVAVATTMLANTGLVLKVDSRRADPKVAADHVLSQDPEPGTILRRQRPVRVRVSDGQRDPFIPSVVGQAERTAEIVLQQERIEIANRAEIRTASYVSDTVVAEDPPAKAQSARVNLLINRGESGASFVMPDVIGALGVRVVDILRRRGFRVTVNADANYPGLPPGVVVRQAPQSGFQIAAGDTVVLELTR